MNFSYISDFLVDRFPYRRKSNLDWIVPGVVGLGVGIAAGVGIGMLAAPRPGYETRRQLREGAERMKERALDAAHRTKQGISSSVKQMEKRAFSNEIGEIR